MQHISQPTSSSRSTNEIETLVRQFETGALQAGAFTHREHLLVITSYLSRFDQPTAAARMREGLYKFLDQHGIDRQKYHETITLFWVRRVRALLAETGPRPLAEAAKSVLAACGDANLINAYYSPELIATAEAREKWVEPDLQPLDF